MLTMLSRENVKPFFLTEVHERQRERERGVWKNNGWLNNHSFLVSIQSDILHLIYVHNHNDNK